MLEVALKCLTSTNLEKRLAGLADIKELIQNARHRDDHERKQQQLRQQQQQQQHAGAGAAAGTTDVAVPDAKDQPPMTEWITIGYASRTLL